MLVRSLLLKVDRPASFKENGWAKGRSRKASKKMVGRERALPKGKGASNGSL